MLTINKAVRKIAHCFDHLPDENVIEYIILKGHLLSEEELLSYLMRAMQNPNSLSNGRFSFFNLIHIAEAMRPKNNEPWLWEALRCLNSLRNDMAHNLQPKKLEKRINTLKDIVFGQIDDASEWLESSAEESLRWAIIFIVCNICSLPKGRKKY